MKTFILISIVVIVLFLLKPVLKVYNDNVNNTEDDNLHPKYNKNVKRGKDGRFKSIQD